MTEKIQQNIRASEQQPAAAPVAPPRPNLVLSPQPVRKLFTPAAASESKRVDSEVTQDDDDDDDDGESNTTNSSSKKRKTSLFVAPCLLFV